jgi:predicted helicase
LLPFTAFLSCCGEVGDASGPELDIETRHVDGTYNAKQREDCLDWLKAEVEDDTCRILTNARCMSEGVDVPSLDAIIFMHPRNRQIHAQQVRVAIHLILVVNLKWGEENRAEDDGRRTSGYGQAL